MRRLLHSFFALIPLVAASPAPAAPAWNAADMDTTCPPCRDFYRFANGGWLDRATILPSESNTSSFLELAQQNQGRLHALLDGLAAARGKRAASDALLGEYWSACMDSAAAEHAGLAPLQPVLSGVESVKDATGLARQIGWLHAHGAMAGFAAFPGPDPRRSELTILTLSQGGLGLPDRDFYTRTDSGSVVLRVAYRDYLAETLERGGDAAAGLDAAGVYALEQALASASMTNVERRDPVATYHKVPLDTLRAWTPGFDWDAYARGRQFTLPDSVNVAQPGFFREFAVQLSATPMATWQSYLRWRVLDQAAPLLGSSWVQAEFAFRSRLSGATELQPRWKRCLRMADQDLGDALGQAFVKRYFPPAARARAQQLVDNVQAALAERITQLDWMSKATQQAAGVKLNAIRDLIGFPNVWRDYAGLDLGHGNLVANRRAAAGWESRRQMARLGGPVERGEWRMSAPTVNAFYSGSFNSINFPAGILQPPFFSADWDDALNYGGIGSVIGHEITHGFDDRGRLFDARGNMRDWWLPEDADRYKERANKVAEQFDAYQVAPGASVNGRLTLGENIADLGGLAIAYSALQKALGSAPRTPIDGYTPDQRFFLSYARVWRRVMRPEAEINQVRTDPHSPGRFRVIGPLSNLDEFARAFGCTKGDPMVRSEELRARIW